MIFVKITILKNGVLYDLEQDKYNMKDVAIKDGKIIELGEKLENNYEEAEIINLNEKLVLPGCIDCHTHLGIIEECTGKIGIDNNETSNPVTPHLNGIDGLIPLILHLKML